MTKIMCDLCGRDIQTDKHLKEARDYVFNITKYGIPIDMCVECRREFREWIDELKEENGMLKKED